MGYSPDTRVSTKMKSLQIWIQVDDHRRFVGVRVNPYPEVLKPFN
jgi:translation initiation factor IF-1